MSGGEVVKPGSREHARGERVVVAAYRILHQLVRLGVSDEDKVSRPSVPSNAVYTPSTHESWFRGLLLDIKRENGEPLATTAPDGDYSYQD